MILLGAEEAEEVLKQAEAFRQMQRNSGGRPLAVIDLRLACNVFYERASTGFVIDLPERRFMLRALDPARAVIWVKVREEGREERREERRGGRREGRREAVRCVWCASLVEWEEGGALVGREQ